MQSIETFFSQKAAAFTDGRICDASADHALPTTIYFGDDIMFVRDAEHLKHFLTSYFDKIAEQGHARTVCTIMGKSPLSQNGTQANVRWTHINHADQTMRNIDMTYFCKVEDSAWKIAMVEVTPHDTCLVSGQAYIQ